MNTRRFSISLAVAAIAVGGGVAFWLSGGDPQGDAVGTTAASSEMQIVTADGASAPLAGNPQWEALRDELRGKYSKSISIPGERMRFVTELLRFLENEAGGFDEALALALLLELFPDQAESLLATLKSFIAYRDWMETERQLLISMGPEERSQRIWDKRRELFGAEAEQIWVAEIRNQMVVERMQSIDQQPGTVATKAAMFTDAIREAYGEQSARMMENHRQELADKFVTLPSVQNQLSALPTAERRQALRDMRATLGMDETALGRWDELDQTRDARWEAGQAYESAKAALPANLSAAEREQSLSKLRQQYLGAEAETVAGEEQAGYFRYKEQRVYGIN